MSALPPAIAASALYDSFLQSALRRFLDRATLETEAIPSASSDGRLAIEPTGDPSALVVRWFGMRYMLRVPPRRPFSAHEIRMARAIGGVLAARFRAILSPQFIAERGELFRGAIEDRYVGAFIDQKPYGLGPKENWADRIASAIEVLRVAALSSYENRPISTGVLLLNADDDPVRPNPRVRQAAPVYSQSLTAIKSFYRLVDGVHTVFLLNRDLQLVDLVDIEQWGRTAWHGADPRVPGAQSYQAHSRATLGGGHVCLVLSPSHEVKVFAEGAQVFAFRGAHWHLLDLEAKYEAWAEGVGNPQLAQRLFQTALDLADAREGALFVVLRDPGVALPQLVAPADRMDWERQAEGDTPTSSNPSRRHLLYLLAGRTATELDPSVLAALASMDGALVMDPTGRLLAGGAILRHPPLAESGSVWEVEGARTTAALAASRFGSVLKVSEDGVITYYDGERVWDI